MSDFNRYGLPANPYRKEPLDSLADPVNAERLLIEVDGCSNLKNRVDSHLQTRIQNSKPAFFLVAGTNGTGRTSVANYILARYCHLTNVKPDQFIVPKREVKNCDEFDTFRNWFAFLRGGIRGKQGKSLSHGLDKFLEKLPTDADRGTMVPLFADLAREVSEALAKQEFPLGQKAPAAFGLCLEDVPKYDIVRAALDIFEEVPTIGIFTTLDYENAGKDVADLFRQKAGAAHQVVELSLLSPDDIDVVVNSRWKACTQVPPPFDSGEVGQALGQKPRSLAKVCVLMTALLELKLNEYPDGCWPHNANLRITAKQIANHVPLLESAYAR